MCLSFGDYKMSNEKKRPLKMFNIDNFRKIPMMGFDNCAAFDKKHKRIKTLFTDTSGFGTEREMAYTVAGFKRKMTEFIEEHGYVYAGFENIGQFQGYIAVWSPEKVK